MDFVTIEGAERAMRMFDGVTVAGLSYIVRPHQRAFPKTSSAPQHKKKSKTNSACRVKSQCVGKPIFRTGSTGPPGKPVKESLVGKPVLSVPSTGVCSQVTLLGGSDNDDRMSDLSSSFEWEESLLESPLVVTSKPAAVSDETDFPFMKDVSQLAEMLVRCGGGMSLWGRFGREGESVRVRVQAVTVVGHAHCWVHVMDSPEASAVVHDGVTVFTVSLSFPSY